MNNYFPMVSMFTLATVASDKIPTTVAEAFTQYGFPALICGVLLWYSFWQEKQRNKRDSVHRDFIEKIITELRAENKELKEKLFQQLK